MDSTQEKQECSTCKCYRPPECHFRTPEIHEKRPWPEVKPDEWCNQWTATQSALNAKARRIGVRPEWIESIQNSKGHRVGKGDFIDMIKGMHKGKTEMKHNTARMQLQRAIDIGLVLETIDREDFHWISLAPDAKPSDEARPTRKETVDPEDPKDQDRLREMFQEKPKLDTLTLAGIYFTELSESPTALARRLDFWRTSGLIRLDGRIVTAGPRLDLQTGPLDSGQTLPPDTETLSPDPSPRPITPAQLLAVRNTFRAWKNVSDLFKANLQKLIDRTMNDAATRATLRLWEEAGLLIACGPDRWKKGPNLDDAADEAESDTNEAAPAEEFHVE